MEAAEQMTIELLEKTMQTMDCRRLNKKLSSKRSAIFYFIRFRRERHFKKEAHKRQMNIL